MKYLKTFGLAVIAATALMAFAGPASATELTSPAGTTVKTGTPVHSISIGHVVFDILPGKMECNSTVYGHTTADNAPAIPEIITEFRYTGCTTATVDVLKSGTQSITSTGGGKGSLSSTGTELTVVTFGLHCIYSTNNTTIGTITGGTPATLAISATIPRTGGTSGAFCGASAPLTGSYEFTSPKPLLID